MKFVLACTLGLLLCSRASAQSTVTVDTTLRYQIIQGWGHGGSVFAGLGGFHTVPDTSFVGAVSRDYIDYVIDDLGLTGSRLWEIGPRIDGTGMDHGDCDSIDWSLFQSDSFFPWQFPWVAYFNDRVIAQGIRPSYYSSPTYPTLATAVKPWVLNHPGERAQQIWASALFYKQTCGVDIDYAVIYNEPGLSFTILADDIKALGPRLAAHGLATKAQFAEGVDPHVSWNYVTQTQDDSLMWKSVGRISYHDYGTADPYRGYLRDFAQSHGMTTAQTEMASPTIDDVYADLTRADCAYWEVGFASGNILPIKSGQTQFSPSNTFFRLRQVLHYVRPRAVRIGAAVDDTMLHVLAFQRDGRITTVVQNLTSTAKQVTVKNLPPGEYGVSQAAYSATAFQELGVRTVGADGMLDFSLGGNYSAATLYPYSEPNHAPCIMTWGSGNGYLVAPVSATTLSAAANDAERDTLRYHWTMATAPAGASPVIATPDSPTSSVNGLTVSGLYVFTIDVRDGMNISSKNVYLKRYDANPPTSLGGAGFRISAPYGLVFSNPGDTTHANIELPTSAVTLQVGVGDLAGSDFTGRGKWSLISAPAGSVAKVDSTIYIYISIRANASGLTVPGDYVFRCVVTDPPYPDLTAAITCTVHPASSAPVISSITAAPPSLTLPATSTTLSAATSDPENDLLRHWWTIKSVPPGAVPVFDHQGRSASNVSGLTVPGSYTFTLRAFDDLHMTTKDITITVGKSTGVREAPTAPDGLEIVSIEPIPSRDLVSVIYILKQESRISATLYDITGHMTSEIFSGFSPPGRHQLGISKRARNLPSGMYFLVLQSGAVTAVRKILFE
jgi:hypothetical protein